MVDVETTGLDLDKDQIISLGAIDFSNPTRTYYEECRLSGNIRPSEEVLAITGFSLTALTDTHKPSVKEVMQRFLKWTTSCSERTLAGENPWFDVMFLRRASREYHLEWPFGHRYVDLHSISYANLLRADKLPKRPNGESDLGLDRTLAYVGLEPRQGPHNALNDAKLEAEALSRFIYGRSLIEEYANQSIPSYLASNAANIVHQPVESRLIQ